MSVTATLSATEVRALLAKRDLTNPHHGHHAIQDLVDTIRVAVTEPSTTVQVRRGNPVVAVSDNYDRLGYPALRHELGSGAVARGARYSRYLATDLMLRAHTSAMIPLLLEQIASGSHHDLTLLCPGMVYRRDVIDRHHVGEPHQIDVWHVRTRPAYALAEDHLDQLVKTVMSVTLPGRRWRTVPAKHSYTLAGRQVDVADSDGWVEVGECGLAHPDVLADSALPAGASGLASGCSLDRFVDAAQRHRRHPPPTIHRPAH